MNTKELRRHCERTNSPQRVANHQHGNVLGRRRAQDVRFGGALHHFPVSQHHRLAIGFLLNDKQGVWGVGWCGGMYGENEGELWESIVENTSPLSEIPEMNMDDLHTIIYTSGTTGNPKGVMHTVRNFSESVSLFSKEVVVGEHQKLFSYLPCF
mgnify:CR=1 FL=1